MTETKPNISDINRKAILERVLAHAAFDGWTAKTLKQAVRDLDLPEGAEALYFSGGPIEVIKFWAEQVKEHVASHLAALDLDSMRIRDKVTEGVLAGLEYIDRHDEPARRAMSRLAFPDAAGIAPALIWAGADTIWRAIGDTSTDVNYYSKRTILSGVIGTSLVAWLSDDSDNKAKARAFLDARIENVMQFEKTKWAFKKRSAAWPNPAEVLGKIRYGRRRRRRAR